MQLLVDIFVMNNIFLYIYAIKFSLNLAEIMLFRNKMAGAYLLYVQYYTSLVCLGWKLLSLVFYFLCMYFITHISYDRNE